MSKLLSDEELYEKLEDMHYKLENTQHTNWDEYTNTLSGFTDLINTQKRLYAESVIGEDEYWDKWGVASDGEYEMLQQCKQPQKMKHRDELRAEQRERIK